MWILQAHRKKISPENYASFFCQESIQGTVSYNDIALKISCEQKQFASRQAYYYRTKEEAVEFLQHILAAVIRKKSTGANIEMIQSTFSHKRILIQDSTIIRLPNKLYEFFSGVRNATTTVCNARIQGVYDLISGKFITFSIDPYSINDLKAVKMIDVQEGDIVLRDRGYFVISSIEGMKENGADSLSRYKHKTVFYDPSSLEEINLLEQLQRKATIDIRVVSGSDKKIKLRIIAAMVPEEVANIRRMKANKEAKHRGSACSYELLQLLGYTIFITTIEDENFTIQQACLLYSLRWRIECIFKTWKSNLNFDKIHNVSEFQLGVLLRARLIMITLIYEKLYKYLEIVIAQSLNKQLSLMKFMQFISRNLISFVKQFSDVTQKNNAIKVIARYCTYEKRKRNNFFDLMTSTYLT